MNLPEPPVPVIYEDNHLLVVEKPANILSQGDQSGDRDLLTILKEDLKRRYNKPGNVFLGLVHRLDRPVGGVMVFAKTSKAASRLSDAIRRGDLQKTYLAAVYGRPEQTHATLVHYVVKDRDSNRVRCVPPDFPGGKKAVLDYELLGTKNHLSLLRIRLHTGRPHQIRVQLAAIGCPLYGDQKYGGGRAKPGEQIALWSSRLSFAHPTLKETVTFASFPPPSYPWLLWPEEMDGRKGS
jgi:23S rRNA pseudouridine1911/1915/1917 synthase